MVSAALAGTLDDATYSHDPVFGLEIPAEVPGVPTEVLTPRNTWANPSAYDVHAAKLAKMFQENFSAFADRVPSTVTAAGPKT
jgi:phosphoenolpyruvate carboxykinase (ATP)